MNETMFHLANLLGYSLAGLAIARLPAGVALAVDAISFVASVITLAAMRSRRSALASAESASGEVSSSASAEAEEAAEAETHPLTCGRYLRSKRVLQILLLIVGLTFLTSDGMLGVALPAFVQGPLKAGAGGYGLLLACYGAGQLVGGLVAGGLGFLRHRAIIVMALAGILNGLINVMYFTVVQEIFPAQFMGRIWGVIMFATYGFYPLSVFIGGVITIHLGPSLMFFISGLTLTVAAVVGLLSREIRALA